MLCPGVSSPIRWHSTLRYRFEVFGSFPSDDNSWDGFSLLIDDVERLHGTTINFPLVSFDQGFPHFFRLAVSRSTLSPLQCYDVRLADHDVPQLTEGGDMGDYTNATSFFPNGT